MTQQPRTGGPRRLLSDYRSRLFARFSHVCEMIAITSVFTTLKYYPSDRRLFVERLVRYARTLPLAADDVLVFEYVSVRKNADAFEFAPAAEFTVDPRLTEVVERAIDETVSVRAGTKHSPIHEGVRPGSYAPRR